MSDQPKELDLRGARRLLGQLEADEVADAVDIPNPARDAELHKLLLERWEQEPTQAASPPVVAASAAVTTQALTDRRPHSAVRRRNPWRIAVPVLLAASLLAVLLPRAWRDEPTLPEYQISLSADAVRMGSPATSRTVAELTLDSLLNLALRPQQAVPADLQLVAQAYLLRGAELTPWPVQPERQPSGTFLLSARVRDLPLLSPGRWSLLFVIAPPQNVPKQAEIAAVLHGQSAKSKTWNMLQAELMIRESAGR